MFAQRPRIALTPADRSSLLLLVLIYLLVGLLGHDPWRGDDLTHFGPILELLRGGSWIDVRHSTSSLTQAPLYYWFAALCGQLFGWLIEPHNASRLASALLTAATLHLLGMTARRLHGLDGYRSAILLGLGTLGLAVHSHEHQPYLALMGCLALGYWGSIRLLDGYRDGSGLTGLSLAGCFLSGGLTGLILLLLPFTIGVMVKLGLERRFVLVKPFIIALLLGGSLSGSWWFALTQYAPDQALLWWQQQLLALTPKVASNEAQWERLGLLSWSIWPLWPLAGWALWRHRTRLLSSEFGLPLIAALVATVSVFLGPQARPASLLPVLPAWLLLATPGLLSLRRGAANAFAWFAVMAAPFFACVIWLGWSAIHLKWPPGLGRHFARLSPEYWLSPNPITVTLGLVLTLVWGWLIYRTRRDGQRAALHWALGVIWVWTLAAVLLIPWFDYSRNYRPLLHRLVSQLPQNHLNCVAEVGVGEAQQIALDYFEGLKLISGTKSRECTMLITYGDQLSPEINQQSWRLLHEVRRGGGRQTELFRIYQRE